MTGGRESLLVYLLIAAGCVCLLVAAGLGVHDLLVRLGDALNTVTNGGSL